MQNLVHRRRFSTHTIRSGIRDDILEHVSNVDVDESSAWQVCIEVVDHCLYIGIEGLNKSVHFF